MITQHETEHLHDLILGSRGYFFSYLIPESSKRSREVGKV